MQDALMIGAFEAKTRLSELLDRASRGEEITITKHERPIAKLVPYEQPRKIALAEVFRRMDEFRAKHPLNPKGAAKLTYKDLIEDGRKR